METPVLDVLPHVRVPVVRPVPILVAETVLQVAAIIVVRSVVTDVPLHVQVHVLRVVPTTVLRDVLAVVVLLALAVVLASAPLPVQERAKVNVLLRALEDARAVALQLVLAAVTLGVIQAVRLRAPKVVPTTAQAVVTMVAIIPVHLNAAGTVGRAVALTARGHVRAIVPITVRPTALMTAQDDVKKSVRRLVQMIV